MASASRQDKNPGLRLLLRSFVFGWAGLAAFAAAAPGQASAAGEQWFLLKIGGTPVGYVREASSVQGAGATAALVSDSTMKMTINRLGSKVAIEVATRSEETADGRLRKIGYDMRASALATKSEAVVKDAEVEVRSEAGGKSYTRTVPYVGILLGPEGVRRLSLEKIRKPGDKIEYQTFSSESETVSKGSQTALAWEDLSFGGRTLRALKVEEILASDGVKTTSWLDEKREVLRQESPTPFGIAEIVLSTREEALRTEGGGSLPEELYTRSIIRTNIRLPRARAIGYLKVRLTAKDASAVWPEFPGPSPKAVGRTAKTIDLEIRRPDAPAPARLPLPASEADKEFLEPNAYIQSDDPTLRAVAAQALAGETDAWQAGLRLERWVAENMSFDLGIALAPSTELFKNRRGTCLGYATLLATLARAVGLPSRVVIGYVYALGMFGGHAWTEVRIAGAWTPLDAAIVAPGVADAARVGLSASSFRDGVGSLISGPAQSVFGRVEIGILEYAGADGLSVIVPENASPYSVEGDVYRNPWLGLRLAKPKGFAFGKLDAVWPDAALVEMTDPDGARAVLQEGYLLPWAKPDEAAAEALARFAGTGKPERVTTKGRVVWRLGQAGKAAAAVLDGPVFWMLTAAGRNAAGILTEMLGGLSFDNPLPARSPEKAR
ncbi:MAG: transglutaminase-like domain-containing protein [Candidatus Aminicenantes bacterium]|nr:transglutaminase-like domain-containing protein [Candidatus Aminicenantes bacterium]